MGFSLARVFQAFQSLEANNSVSKLNQLNQRSLPNAGLGYQNRQAIVQQAIQPQQRGRVRFWGSDWFARCDQEITISPGEVVDVIGVESITLLVEPAYLLACSKLGLTKAQQAWMRRGWTLPAANGMKPDVEATQLLIAHSQDLSETAAIETWKRFIQGKPVYISKFKACCELLELDWQEIVGYGNVHPQLVAATDVASVPVQTEQPALGVAQLNFVGRSSAITDLTRLVQSGATAIVILGEGGIGKTTLAQHYFKQNEFDIVLECWMAKQTQNIISAEGIVQEWLRQHFGEEPACDFQAALTQLQRCLQDRLQANSADRSTVNRSTKIGILIDNLEPALDRNGQIIEAHRDYAALLKVLSDGSMPALTLITSREPIRETNVVVQPYILPGLTETAWQQFLTNHQVQANSPVLGQIHRAYGGNAKAMTILSSAISLDYEGNLEAFWQEHQANLLEQTDLEDLVTGQFARLQQLYPEAYRLLLRLSCYRYQSISAVPIEALYCLLWDVPDVQRRNVVRFLEDLFLVEVKDNRYYLHPVIQAKATALLRNSPDWEFTNRQAAEFWTMQVQSIETIENALTAYQAYYHYLYIGDYDAAASTLLQKRNSKWAKDEPLGVSFYRLGLLRRMISAINRVIDRVQSGYASSKLSNILGDLYWFSGNVHRAIACHQKAKEVAIAHQLRDLEIVSIYNTGLCKIQLWELEDALTLFQTVNQLAANTEHHVYAVGSWFCLAYLHSCLGQNQEAATLTQKVFNEHATLNSESWSRGYSLLFLGRTMKNLGNDKEASRMYTLAREFAEKSQYAQVKASALNGLAVIYRDRQDFRDAINNHLAARRLLERIEARGDLAEVCYQLGLTYLKMNEFAEGRSSLQQAIDLFRQMDAPKQVAKVQQVLEDIT